MPHVAALYAHKAVPLGERMLAGAEWVGDDGDAGLVLVVVMELRGHASATMTMDLYGHLMDANLWEAARRFVDISRTPQHHGEEASEA